jgi:hypothetical protein
MLRRLDRTFNGARSIAMRALGLTVYRRLEWFPRKLGVDIPLFEPGVPIEYGFLDLDAAMEWTAMHPHLDAAEVHRRFARGDGSRHEGRLVSVSLVSTGHGVIENLGITVPGRADLHRPAGERLGVAKRARVQHAPDGDERLGRDRADSGGRSAVRARASGARSLGQA